ncbi:MAG: NADH-quinone oxidoreductase subunit N [Calditrichaeota bacterium]|nr:NADH-quinone oxidoreductase subunit N [Calditrichota bacterium]MCB9368422.1 NADH-quinone oxidoreductase subunit N [Calditrichota bacterium]
MNSNDFLGIIPELIVVLTALVAIVVDVRNKEKNASASQGVTIIGLAVTGIIALFSPSEPGMLMSGQVFNDGFSEWFRALFAFVGMVTAIYSPLYLRFRNIRLGEYYSLLSMCVFGMMVMATAANLLLFFVGLETMSIALYVLVGLRRNDASSIEGGMKYLVLGAFSSAFLLYGMALIYGGIGSLDYAAISQTLLDSEGIGPMTASGIALLLVGFAFKVSAVPFHFWSPDVYDGAPTSITAFMSTGAKAAAFIGLIRVFGQSLATTSHHWITALSIIAALTMTIGNFTALRQVSVKRMLAYSSVAHAGYLLVGIVAGTREAFAASGFYLIGYALMNLGAFGVLMLLNQRGKGDYSFDSLRGMGTVHPVLGLTMTVFMLSLIGIPPTAGFFGKLYVFSAAIKEGHILLAVIGFLNSAVAAYYYLKVISTMYMTKPEGDVTVPQPMPYKFALAVSSILIIVIGLFPDQLVNAMLNAVP